MEQIIDEAWSSLLLNAMKKRHILRALLGDEIDLYVPQSRLLAIAQADPKFTKTLYDSALCSAERNARNIVRRLGMPADYFWKFEYWPKARALTSLSQIVNKVFSSIMAQAKEGNLELIDIDIDPLRLLVRLDGCVECAGINTISGPMCHYHAGTTAGILSGLINRKLGSYEKECHGVNGEACLFIVGDKDSATVLSGQEEFLSPAANAPDLLERSRMALQHQPTRDMGNLVDVSYYRLIMANSFMTEPSRSSKIGSDAGYNLGKNLANVLADIYARQGLDNLKNYYQQLGQMNAEFHSDEDKLTLLIEDCAECVSPNQHPEMLAFLLGEIRGLVSEQAGREAILLDYTFDNERLEINLRLK